MKNERKKTKNPTKRPSVLNNPKNKNLIKNKKKEILKEKRKLPIDFPEAIAGTIINKIISNVIRETTVKEIYSHMDKKCFTYVKYLINPYLSTEYLNYENGLDNIEYQKNKINYKVHVTEKVNTWTYLPEPCTPGNDRFSSGLTKLISLKNEQIENDEKYKDIKEILKRPSNFNRDVIVNESIEFENEIKKSKKKLVKIKKSKKRKSTVIEEIENKQKEKELEKERIKEERRKEKEKKEIEEKILKELPYEDLPKEKYENKYIIKNDNEENNELRKEREHLIKKKLELKMIQDMQDKKDKLIKFQNRLQRNFDGSKQTFDSEGNILLIHSPKVDHFINEFKFAKVPSIQNEPQKKNTNTIITTKTKSQISLPSKNVTKLNNTNNTSSVNNLKESKSKNDWDNKPVTNPEFKLIFDYIKEVLIPKWLNKPYNIMNKTKTNGDEKDSERKKYNSSPKSFKAFFGPFLNKYVYKVNVIRNPYDMMRNNQIFVRNPISKNKRSNPSGSNFNLISPETGVVIESQINKKKEIKDGGFEYIKKYNKPSMYEFSKLVMETSNLNSLNSRALSSGLIESKINELNEIKKANKYNEINKDDYNGYILEFSDNMNPLFQNALSINDKENENVDNKDKTEIEKYKSKDKNIFREMEEGYLKSRYNSMNTINLQKSIKLSNDINNLYSYFEDKDNINNNISKNIDNDKSLKIYSTIRNKKRNININNDNSNKNNIIIYQAPLPVIKAHRVKSNKSEIRERKNRIKGRRILNKFNYSIIKDENWGEEDQNKINEKLRLEQLNSLKNKNDENNVLKKVGENIIKINNNNRLSKKLIKSASAGNIF